MCVAHFGLYLCVLLIGVSLFVRFSFVIRVCDATREFILRISFHKQNRKIYREARQRTQPHTSHDAHMAHAAV